MDTPSYILFDQGPQQVPQAFVAPSDLIVAQTPEEVPAAFAAMQSAREAGHWLAGYASYELGYVLEPKIRNRLPEDRRVPLICFGVFDGPNTDEATALLAQGEAESTDASLSKPEPLWDEDTYQAAFEQAQAYIRSGDFYQTNLTFPMRSRWSGTVLGLYSALRQVQPVAHGALVNLGQGPVLASRSPELFFRVGATGRIETRPMKGTVPRGKTEEEDRQLATFLQNDEKNRAENLMIVDLLRNDMSRVSKAGTVEVPELFTIEKFATVHQMTSMIEAVLKNDMTISGLFHALFPCGSITGAPKVRAMEVIDDLEQEPRDIYCGSIGWMAPGGEMRFNVAIRTLTLEADGEARLNVGGGVVYDSTGPSEYEEALWKARYTNLNPTT